MWSRVPRYSGPENNCAGKDLQQIVYDRRILSGERMLHKDYNRKLSVEKITGRGSRETWRKDNCLAVNRQW
jgi:hypothetical protein